MAHTKKHRFNKHQKSNSTKTMADKADVNVLYEQSVQCVESEIDFVDETFQKLRGRKAEVLREDFCGTANTSCEWVRRREINKAIAVDLNEEVLAWGQEHKVGKLTEEQTQRITLVNDNVMSVDTGKVDIALAMNFSYWTFEDRPTMIQYFKKIHDSLFDDGILFLDAFGGYEAYQEMKERTEHSKFTYVWDQASYNPITGHCICHIHFKFKDGSKINKAFTYEWRLWSLPELTEMLTEAGFKATVYWEGTDEDTDEGNGIFTVTSTGEADAGWIAYIAAEK